MALITTILESGMQARSMGAEYTGIAMEMYMKVNGQKTAKKEKANITTEMGISIRVHGKMIKCRGLENTQQRMGTSIKETGTKALALR